MLKLIKSIIKEFRKNFIELESNPIIKEKLKEIFRKL